MNGAANSDTAAALAALKLPVYLIEEFKGRRGLPDEVIAALAPREPTTTDLSGYPNKGAASPRARIAVNTKASLALLPYWSPTGDAVPNVGRVRILNDGDRLPKYVGPTTLPPNVYLPRNVKMPWDQIAADSACELVVTEGEISSAVACHYGLLCLGIPGVWSFKSTKAGFQFPPQLARWVWKDRRVVIVFDSDIMSKAGVRAALHALARELMRLGANVVTKTLPDELDGRKNGIDDLLIRHGRDAYDAIPAEEFEAIRELRQINQEFVRVLNEDENYELTTGVRRNDQHFQSHLAPRRLYLPSGSGNRMIDVSAAEEWLKWKHRREVQGYTFDGKQGLLTADNEINLFRGLPGEAKEGSVDLLYFLLDQVFGTSEEGLRMREQWLRWAAYAVQNPGVKMYTIFLLISVTQGTGKSLLFEVLGSVFGGIKGYFNEIKQKQLYGDFNTWADRKLFILSNENSNPDRRAAADFVKNLATDKFVHINAKFKNEITYPDQLNYGWTSNHWNCVSLSVQDRRFTVWGVPEFRTLADGSREPNILTEAKGTEISRWANSTEGRPALRYFFEHYETGDFSYADRALESTAKDRVIAASRSDLDADAENLLMADNSYKVDRTIVGAELGTGDVLCLEVEIRRLDPNGTRRITRRALTNSLSESPDAGPLPQIRVSERIAKMLGKPRIRPFAVRHVDYWLARTDTEVASALDARYPDAVIEALKL